MGNVIAIIDGQAGSCGKGKFAGYSAIKENASAAIANNMPNAGHTFLSDGKKRIFRNIPVSAVNPNTTLFIGPGSVIDMNILEKEYYDNRDILEQRDIIVHPLVPLIEARHIEYEKQHIRSGSTFKGCAACIAEKILRDPNLKFFSAYKNIKVDEKYYEKLYSYLNNSRKIILEGSQGTDLDINHSGHYPYTTSRQVSLMQMLADSGLPRHSIYSVIMVIRPFPIRISNQNELGIDIYTGDYGNSLELTYENINISSSMGTYPTIDLNLEMGYEQPAYNLSEQTTVTKRKRRIFDLDIDKLKHSIMINKPDEIALNFFEQLDIDYLDVSGNYHEIYFNRYLREYINYLETSLGVDITMLGTGADNQSLILRR